MTGIVEGRWNMCFARILFSKAPTGERALIVFGPDGASEAACIRLEDNLRFFICSLLFLIPLFFFVRQRCILVHRFNLLTNRHLPSSHALTTGFALPPGFSIILLPVFIPFIFRMGHSTMAISEPVFLRCVMFSNALLITWRFRTKAHKMMYSEPSWGGPPHDPHHSVDCHRGIYTSLRNWTCVLSFNSIVTIGETGAMRRNAPTTFHCASAENRWTTGIKQSS